MRTGGNMGFTLVELLVVISIIGLLAIALGFSYVGWMGSYKVESATKGLFSDMMDARARAMQTNSTYLIDFTATSYRIGNDTNGNGAIDNAEILPTFPKTVGYPLVGGVGVILTFNPRGLISSGNPPVLIDPATPVTISLTSTTAPDYDCIVMSETRLNIGQMTPGGVCNAK